MGQRRAGFDLARSSILIGIVLSTVPGVSYATETLLNLSYTAEHSDNARRSSSLPYEDIANIYQVETKYFNQGPRLDVDIAADLAFRSYVHGAYEDDWQANLNAKLLWYISPRRFQWHLDDLRRPIRADNSLPFTLSNKQNFDLLTTGPDYFIRLSPTTTIGLEARTQVAQYDVTSLYNSHRNSGTLRWIRRSSEITTYSLNEELSRLNYDETSAVDYTKEETYVRWKSQTKRGDYQVDLGLTNAEQASAIPTKGHLGRFTGDFKMSPQTKLTIFASHEISDFANGITITQDSTTEPSGSLATNIFWNDRIAAYYSTATNTDIDTDPDKFSLTGYVNRRTYPLSGEVELITGAKGEWGRQLFSQFRGEVYGSISQTIFQLTPLDNAIVII